MAGPEVEPSGSDDRVQRAAIEHMMQEWANLVDAWGGGQTYVPKLMPENVTVPALSAIA